MRGALTALAARAGAAAAARRQSASACGAAAAAHAATPAPDAPPRAAPTAPGLAVLPGSPPVAIVFLGAPGVGKGTYSTRVAAALGADHVSAGDLVRAEIKAGTALGKQVSEAGSVCGFACVCCVRARRRALAASAREHPPPTYGALLFWCGGWAPQPRRPATLGRGAR